MSVYSKVKNTVKEENIVYCHDSNGLADSRSKRGNDGVGEESVVGLSGGGKGHATN